MTPLKKKISEKIDESADWDQFQIQFSLAYPDFIEKLTAQYSDLRSGDIKLCCYLKMNMNTKDIAQITGLSHPLQSKAKSKAKNILLFIVIFILSLR